MNEEQKFNEYVQKYDMKDGQIALKIRHTWKVVEAADTIAASLPLDEHTRRMVHVAALFHDIGRFEQVRRWHTFVDARSVDHAHLGWQILRQGHFLDDYDEREQDIIMDAVRMHSQFALPENLEEPKKTIAQIVRDADKVDIFRVSATEEMKDTFEESRQELEAQTITPAVFQALMEGRSVRRDERKTALDRLMSFLGFFADLNYPCSFAMADSQGYWKVPFTRLRFENRETRQQVEQAVAHVEAMIAEKTGRQAETA